MLPHVTRAVQQKFTGVINAVGLSHTKGYWECFNAKLRDEFLNGELFYGLAEAKFVIRSRFDGHAERSSQRPVTHQERNRITRWAQRDEEAAKDMA